MEPLKDRTLDEYADEFVFDGGEPKISDNSQPQPNSFWVAWYEERPTVIQIADCGQYFYALGQDALWHIQHAELVKEIDVKTISDCKD